MMQTAGFTLFNRLFVSIDTNANWHIFFDLGRFSIIYDCGNMEYYYDYGTGIVHESCGATFLTFCDDKTDTDITFEAWRNEVIPRSYFRIKKTTI